MGTLIRRVARSAVAASVVRLFPPALRRAIRDRLSQDQVRRWRPVSPDDSLEYQAARMWAESQSADALARIGLRAHAPVMRDALAIRATQGHWMFRDIAAAFRDGPPADLPVPVDHNALVQLSRLVNGHPISDNDADLSWHLLQLAVAPGLHVADQHAVPDIVGQFIERGQADRVPALLERIALSDSTRAMLTAELSNPFSLDQRTRAASDAEAEWVQALNSIVPHPDVAPLRLLDIDAHPFDRLRAEGTQPVSDGPLITIIMATFRPDEAMLQSVESIIAQTWQRWELIIVDDASGDEFGPVLARARALDPRIRTITAPTNGGAYRARNIALPLASGELVTFHDDDDWMHPQRLELQAAHLLANPTVPANTCTYLRMTPSGRLMVQSRLPGIRPAEVSILFRREQVLERVGGFDPVRKGGDTEFRFRLEAAFGVKIPILSDLPPLLWARFAPTSLSGGDFQAEWVHDTRVAYAQRFFHWHHLIRSGQESGRVDTEDLGRAFPAPLRMTGGATAETTLDDLFILPVVPSGRRDPRAEEVVAAIRKALAMGRSVGVMTLQSPHNFLLGDDAGRAHERPRLTPLSTEIGQLIQDGEIAAVVLSESTRASTAHVFHPELLYFTPADAHGLRADAWQIHHETPSEPALPAVPASVLEGQLRRSLNLEASVQIRWSA